MTDEGISSSTAVAEHVVRYRPPQAGRRAAHRGRRGASGERGRVSSTCSTPSIPRSSRSAASGSRSMRLHCGRVPDFVLRILCLYEFDARLASSLRGRLRRRRPATPRSASSTSATSRATALRTSASCASPGRSPTPTTGATSTRCSRCSPPTSSWPIGRGSATAKVTARTSTPSSRSVADVATASAARPAVGADRRRRAAGGHRGPPDHARRQRILVGVLHRVQSSETTT